MKNVSVFKSGDLKQRIFLQLLDMRFQKIIDAT